jgi:hypothetical protein
LRRDRSIDRPRSRRRRAREEGFFRDARTIGPDEDARAIESNRARRREIAARATARIETTARARSFRARQVSVFFARDLDDDDDDDDDANDDGRGGRGRAPLLVVA